MPPTQPLAPVRRFLAVRVMPAAVIAIASVALWLGLDQMRLARDSATWPAVDGEVVGSTIERETSTSGGSGGSRSVTYRPVVTYRYEVAGVTHEGRLIAFGEYATADQEHAEAVVARYPVGRRVRVFHRPDDHGQAVLEPGSHGAPWLYALLGAIFLAVGLVLAWVAPKLIAPRPAAAR